ncbi:hypothetical protein LPN01_13120 [Sphingomonas sp. A2-49]|uniref:hypothetical protein n=1 Tax=Sphingomonas sp. A2-49 TaxID=1391375 RepID=UPI0021D05FBE|nr:hypothetical protein [Sphingomonas sp. A2-49]MCU6455021.1 hypothetical protein [Sphingomonas sp. A2-49]
MFVDFRNQFPPPPWQPEPEPARRPPLTPRQRKAVEAIAAFNIVMLLCAPLAGATVLQGVAAVFR